MGYEKYSPKDQETYLQYYSNLPDVTITALEEGSSIQDIKVPSQRVYKGRKPVIESSLADTPCAELGVNRLLETLNSTLGTKYDLTPSLSSLLEAYISDKYDFGTAYGHLRSIWFDCDLSEVQKSLYNEATDLKIRDNVVVDGQITEDGQNMAPRRVWDLFSNRVVPWLVALHIPWGISHAWMEEGLRENVVTPINGRQWPVPIPKDASLDSIRIEMLNLGAEYAWLDVLCLRQKGGLDEDLRAEEWKLDVPTIGNAYAAGKVVCYFSGLGRPLKQGCDDSLEEGHFDSNRSWFKRTWTLQETSDDWMIGGDTGDKIVNGEVRERFKSQLSSVEKVTAGEYAYLFDSLSLVRDRAAENEVDRVAALAYFLPCYTIPAAHDGTRPSTSVTGSPPGEPTSVHMPAYSEKESPDDAWTALVKAIAHRSEMLFLYHEPGPEPHAWRPSWDQAMNWKECVPAGTSRTPVEHNVETDTYSYDGLRIDSVHIDGLVTPTAIPRKGHLIVRWLGEEHQYEISANHQQVIPDGIYSLLIGGCTRAYRVSCVVGKLSDQTFTKISVIEVDSAIEKSGVAIKSRIVL
ncbi:hypothetical protein ARMSODRAFT_954582, partial [Armillaria solidipes]